jgi:UDP-GlcNAc:undecaprenyl-phosphate GlcNAc-1-phosphate transferase
MSFLPAALGFSIALLACLALTPWIRRLAIRLGGMDRPDGSRKTQQAPVPLGGGISVALSASLACLVAVWMLSSPDVAGQLSLIRGLLPAALVLVAVGLIDDFCGLTGIYKLIGQMLSVSLLVASGSQFGMISLFGWEIPFGGYAIPFSIFFCLGAINAFNLLDGADGLAGSVGTVVFLTLGIITWSLNDLAMSVLCFSFAGGLVGFLRYNLAPARIYLGDTGSMLIGLVVAAVAIDCSIKQQAALALLVPVAVCAIPILDVGAALIRRMTTGQSVFTPDRGHLHHALLLRGWSVNKTVGFIASLTAITCGGAIASFFLKNEFFALFAAVGVAVMLAWTRIFGHGEARLVISHLRALYRRGLRRTAHSAAMDDEDTVRLQGQREWQNVWDAIREAAPVYHLQRLRLNVNIPHLHESFYGSWNKSNARESAGTWRLQMPLIAKGKPIGKLTIQGLRAGTLGLLDMQGLLEFLEPLEVEIEHLIAGVPSKKQDHPGGLEDRIPAGNSVTPVKPLASKLATAK